MIKVLLFFGLVTISSTLFPGLARGDGSSSVFDFVLTQYPRSQLSCGDTAQSLAKTFSQNTGLTVFKTECKPFDSYNNLITIWYVSPQRLPFISTDSIRVVSTGFYPSASVCSQDLKNQIALFQNETGLSPFFAYCFQDQGRGAHAFSSRLDAFGPAKKFPYSYSGLVFGAPVEKEASILAELKASLASQGFNLSLGAIGNSYGSENDYELAFRYYSRVSANGSFDLRSFYSESPEVCLQQEQGLRKLLSTVGIAATVMFCSDDRVLFQGGLHVLFNRVVPWFSEENVVGSYPSFSSCESDKTKILDFYRKTLGKNPFGAICVNNSFTSSYRMRMLSKCSPDNVTPQCEMGSDLSDPFPLPDK